MSTDFKFGPLQSAVVTPPAGSATTDKDDGGFVWVSSSGWPANQGRSTLQMHRAWGPVSRVVTYSRMFFVFILETERSWVKSASTEMEVEFKAQNGSAEIPWISSIELTLRRNENSCTVLFGSYIDTIKELLRRNEGLNTKRTNRSIVKTRW